jgi:hypothetical protein
MKKDEMGGPCSTHGREEKRSAYNILVGKPEGIDHSEDLSVRVKIMLKWIVGK